MAKKLSIGRLEVGLTHLVPMKTILFHLTPLSSVSANLNLMVLKLGRLNRILTLTTIH